MQSHQGFSELEKFGNLKKCKSTSNPVRRRAVEHKMKNELYYIIAQNFQCVNRILKFCKSCGCKVVAI